MDEKLKQDWIQILQQGNEYPSEKARLAAKLFTGASAVLIEKDITYFDYVNIQLNLDKFPGLELVQYHPFGHSLPFAEQLEVTPGVYKSYYRNCGMWEIKYRGIKVAIELYNRNKQEVFISGICKIEDKESLDNFITELLQFANEHSPFKNNAMKAGLTYIHLDREYVMDDLIIATEKKVLLEDALTRFVDKQEIFAKYGMSQGILIHGVPGTGKTLLAKILASKKDKKYSLLWIVPSDFLRLKPAGIYALARKLKPTIVFLEDLDLFGESRSLSSNKELLGEFLNELSGLNDNTKILTIATTNDLQAIEKALKDRPGRFDLKVEMTVPDQDCRKIMFSRFSSAFKCSFDLERVATLYAGLTGAHIQEAINQAIYNSLLAGDVEPEITEARLEEILPKIKNIKIAPKMGFNQTQEQSHYDED
jgi:AAA+ superfamily predicted ATPase